MVARRGLEHSSSQLWAGRAAVTLYVQYGEIGDRRARKIGGGLGGVEAQVQPRRPSPGQLEQPHMYDDMRMNQNTGVATIVTGMDKNGGSWLLDCSS